MIQDNIMESKSWKLIRLLNEKYLRIPPQVSDFIAVQDILKSCVNGLSNTTISRHLNMDEEYITGVLSHYIEFEGWKQDLDFSPYFIYLNSNENFSKYLYDIEVILQIDVFDLALKTFTLCGIYDVIINEINKYYERENKK